MVFFESDSEFRARLSYATNTCSDWQRLIALAIGYDLEKLGQKYKLYRKESQDSFDQRIIQCKSENPNQLYKKIIIHMKASCSHCHENNTST